MVRFGWDTFKKRPWFFVGMTLLIGVISGVLGQVGSFDEKTVVDVGMIIALAGVFVSVVGQILMKMGTISFALKAHDAPEHAKVVDLWAPEMFWKYFLASLLVGLIVIVGLILLIVPGIIWGLRYAFVPYLIIDRKLPVMDALRESARITLGHKWQLLGLVIVFALLNILGAIALLVGLLVTIPVTMLAFVHTYRTLEHAANEVTPVSVSA